MGIYLERIKNLSIEPINFTIELDDNVLSQITEVANEESNSYIGLSILTSFWVVLYVYILRNQELFKINQLQAAISVSAIVFTISVYFIWTRILVNTQHFIWFSMLYFLMLIWGVLRY